jgi:hypothetical protein
VISNADHRTRCIWHAATTGVTTARQWKAVPMHQTGDGANSATYPLDRSSASYVYVRAVSRSGMSLSSQILYLPSTPEAGSQHTTSHGVEITDAISYSTEPA